MNDSIAINLQSDYLKYEFTLRELDTMFSAVVASERRIHDSVNHSGYTFDTVHALIMHSRCLGYIDALIHNVDGEKIAWFMQDNTRQLLCACLNGFQYNEPTHQRVGQAWDLFLNILSQRDIHVNEFWEQD